jgi:hypothetical protein
MQQKQSNYDTDLFTGTIKKLEEITGKSYAGTDDKKDVAFRVLADHIRAICFTIADGQLPSNTGAGYVIRRILRRAVRYYYSYLDYKQPLLYQLLPVIAGQFKDVFPATHNIEFAHFCEFRRNGHRVNGRDSLIQATESVPNQLMTLQIEKVIVRNGHHRGAHYFGVTQNTA